MLGLMVEPGISETYSFFTPVKFFLNHTTVFVDMDFRTILCVRLAPTPLVCFLSFYFTPHGLLARCVATLWCGLVALIVAACFRSLVALWPWLLTR
jgi:hypothetical protein